MSNHYCEICDHEYVSIYEYKRHLNSAKHIKFSKGIAKIFKCYVCKKIYETKQNMTTHFNSKFHHKRNMLYSDRFDINIPILNQFGYHLDKFPSILSNISTEELSLYLQQIQEYNIGGVEYIKLNMNLYLKSLDKLIKNKECLSNKSMDETLSKYQDISTLYNELWPNHECTMPNHNCNDHQKTDDTMKITISNQPKKTVSQFEIDNKNPYNYCYLCESEFESDYESHSSIHQYQDFSKYKLPTSIKNVPLDGQIDKYIETILSENPKSFYQLLGLIYDYNTIKNYVLEHLTNLPLVNLIRESIIQYTNYLLKHPNSRSHPNYPSEKIGMDLYQDIMTIFGKYLKSMEIFVNLSRKNVLPTIYKHKFKKGKCSICEKHGLNLTYCSDGDFACKSCIKKHGIKLFDIPPIPIKYKELYNLTKQHTQKQVAAYHGKDRIFQ
jgi:hypothetical protein